MDANKLKVLRELPYSVRKTCGLCTHGVFPNNDWGTCQRQNYEHLKHTGEARQLSIVRYGSCPAFEFHKPLEPMLAHFAEFLEDTPA